MLIFSMLAGASSLVLMTSAPQDCAAQQNVVPVSRTPAASDVPREGATLPNAAPKHPDPAVTLPKCQTEPRKKRRKRLSDYPMA